MAGQQQNNNIASICVWKIILLSHSVRRYAYLLINYISIEISRTAIDQWPPLKGIYQNLDGGFPLAIYNQAMDTTVVLSPATTFMSSTLNSFKDPQTNDTSLTFGPMSSIDEVFEQCHI